MPARYEQYVKANPPKGDLYTWLTGSWSDSKYGAYLVMKQIPGVKNLIDMTEGRIDNVEYLNRYDMDMSDVTHPWRLPGTSKISGAVSGSLNFVSKNLERLYR